MKARDYTDLKVWQTGMRQPSPCHCEEPFKGRATWQSPRCSVPPRLLRHYVPRNDRGVGGVSENYYVYIMTNMDK